MKLILIRHPIWNKNTDSPTKETEKQVKEILKRLRKLKINKVYSSPTRRALYLAEKISEDLKKPLLIDPLLKERNEGIYKDEDTLEKKAEELRLHYVEYKPPNGESVLDALKRSEKFLEKIGKEEGNIVIVTHYTNILCFYSLIRGIDIREVWDNELVDPDPGEIKLKI